MTDSQSPDQETLPQTTTVFDRPQLQFDAHEWHQQGYFVTDACIPKTVACEPVGIPIPSGKLLVRKDGHYDLIDEQRR